MNTSIALCYKEGLEYPTARTQPARTNEVWAAKFFPQETTSHCRISLFKLTFFACSLEPAAHIGTKGMSVLFMWNYLGMAFQRQLTLWQFLLPWWWRSRWGQTQSVIVKRVERDSPTTSQYAGRHAYWWYVRQSWWQTRSSIWSHQKEHKTRQIQTSCRSEPSK